MSINEIIHNLPKSKVLNKGAFSRMFEQAKDNAVRINVKEKDVIVKYTNMTTLLSTLIK